jgi:MFS family permease
LIGTSIEFFDFYAYATAAALLFPRLFFPRGDLAAATLQSLATFALAFFARPLGAAVFGHLGDRAGRKTALVASLLTMGASTVTIGLLPTYATVGALAPLLLALCRLGQGFGLGGEWGGAVLLATENAEPGKRAWYGMFPQLGAPIGFLASATVFLFLSSQLSEAHLFAWGWRIPFLASSILVFVGLYVRLRLTETPEFLRVIEHGDLVRMPMLTVAVAHFRPLVLGMLAANATLVSFYLLTVFAQAWGTSHLGYTRPEMLTFQLVGMFAAALLVPVAAVLADWWSARGITIVATIGLVAFGFGFAPLLNSGTSSGMLVFSVLGLGLTGLAYSLLGTALAELFPTPVRYTAVSLSFNLAGILGASLTPYAATWLAARYELNYVGYYFAGASLVTLIAVLLMRPSR